MIARVLFIVVLLGGCGSFPCDASQLAATRRTLEETGRTTGGRVVLDRTVTLFTSSEGSEPIQKAVEDLAADLQAVFGAKPRIIHRKDDAGPLTIYVSEQSRLPEELRASGLTG